MAASDDDFVDVVAQLTPDELQHLYVALGVESRDIIKAELNANTLDVSPRARNVLRFWRQINGRAATREVLLAALEKCKYRNAREELEEKWNMKLTSDVGNLEPNDVAAQQIDSVPVSNSNSNEVAAQQPPDVRHQPRVMATDVDFVDVVAHLVPDEFQHLYFALHLGYQEIEQAEVRANTSDVSLKARSVLRFWRQRNGHAATREVLLAALEKCKYRNAREELEEKWNMIRVLDTDTLTYNDLVIDEDNPIGRGSHSTVFRATFKRGAHCRGFLEAAVKNLHRQEDKEVEIMKKLSHQNIVTFLGYVKYGPSYYIVMEKCEQSLWKYLQDPRNPLDNQQRKKWCFEGTEAVCYLHENAVVHRDIRTKNCLLTSNKTLKMADFGISKIAYETEHTTNRAGTIPYIAPEIIDESKYSIASDIYALGFLFWEIYTREIPKPIDSRTDLGEYIKEGHNIPGNMSDLMFRCWERDHTKRPVIEEVRSQITTL